MDVSIALNAALTRSVKDANNLLLLLLLLLVFVSSSPFSCFVSSSFVFGTGSGISFFFFFSFFSSADSSSFSFSTLTEARRTSSSSPLSSLASSSLSSSSSSFSCLSKSFSSKDAFRTANPSAPAPSANVVAIVSMFIYSRPPTMAKHRAMRNRLDKCTGCAINGPGMAQARINAAGYCATAYLDTK